VAALIDGKDAEAIAQVLGHPCPLQPVAAGSMQQDEIRA
jgi:hypothetical protein